MNNSHELFRILYQFFIPNIQDTKNYLIFKYIKYILDRHLLTVIYTFYFNEN